MLLILAISLDGHDHQILIFIYKMHVEQWLLLENIILFISSSRHFSNNLFIHDDDGTMAETFSF